MNLGWMRISLMWTIWLVTFTKGECILISLSCGFDVAEEIEIFWGSAICSSFVAFFFSYFFLWKNWEELVTTLASWFFLLNAPPKLLKFLKKHYFCNNNDWRPWWLHDCGLVKIYSMLNFDIILILTYIKALKRIKFNGYVTGKC